MRPAPERRFLGATLLAVLAAAPFVVRAAPSLAATTDDPAALPSVSASASQAPGAPGSASPSAGPAEAAPAAASGSAHGHWVYVDENAPPKASASAAVPVSAPPPTGPMQGLYERATTWDLNLEGGAGRFFGSEDQWTGFGRARAGILFIREPFYDAIGITYDFSSLSPATLGLQGEILHLDSGLWAQAGGLVDIGHSPVRLGAMAALGWSLFGVEAQVRSYEDYGTGVAIFAKVRLPISIMARMFSTHHESTKTPPAATAN